MILHAHACERKTQRMCEATISALVRRDIVKQISQYKLVKKRASTDLPYYIAWADIHKFT